MKLKIRWEVDDGYAGKSRPHNFTFNTEDYVDDDEWQELSGEVRQSIVLEAIQEEFDNKVSFTYEIEEEY